MVTVSVASVQVSVVPSGRMLLRISSIVEDFVSWRWWMNELCTERHYRITCRTPSWLSQWVFTLFDTQIVYNSKGVIVVVGGGEYGNSDDNRVNIIPLDTHTLSPKSTRRSKARGLHGVAGVSYFDDASRLRNQTNQTSPFDDCIANPALRAWMKHLDDPGCCP